MILFLAGKTMREVLADVRWRWASDEQDAEQRRRHEEDRHRLDMERARLELAREFPDGTPSPRPETGSRDATRALMAPKIELPEESNSTIQGHKTGGQIAADADSHPPPALFLGQGEGPS